MPMNSPTRLLGALLAAVALIGAGAATAQARNLTELRNKLKSESRKLGSASGAYVVDLGNGRELFKRNADKSLAPASNEKLFTTAVALLHFGEAGTLETTAQLEPGVAIDADGRLAGDLYLVGGGDPSLNDVGLKGLAERLVTDTGLKAITGGIVGDESFFDTRRGSFDSGFAPDDDLGGQLGGLTWGHGRATPGGPATVAAARLQFFLEQLRVKVKRAARSRALSAAPTGVGQVVGRILSPPMKTLAAITNQPSDNFYAETLVKDLGATFGTRGTTSAGLKVIRTRLKTLGLTPKLADGSGLSRADRATPRQLVTLLREMSASAVSTAFIGSLAVPGRLGTLSGRMRGTAAAGRCQAKTGTLRGVSALSGYCRTISDRIIAFSFLENNMDALSAKAIEDRMVPAIVSYKP
jgi:D-alanyl-D-alanine carboxypeptidase/D-alanyl-D-alanine-endopeptidase (penicillin-binding protein 4)